MRKEEIKNRIEKLKKTINYHRYLYHVLDKQEISGEALDSLKKELFDLEQEYPEFITLDSPTQRVGGKPLGKFEKIKHSEPMLSFNDAFSQEDMNDWLKRISKLLTPEEVKLLTVPSHHPAEGGTGSEGFYCELKIDGLAIELVYKNEIFKAGATRGDGIIGEDITENIKTIEAVPLKLRQKPEVVSVLQEDKISPEIIKNIIEHDFKNPIIARGEIFIPKKVFEKANKEQEKANLPVYANPRNLAAGSIRQLDPKVTASRQLDSFAYELITDFGQITHEEKHKILKAIGFKINFYNKYCQNLEEVFKFYENAQKIREKLAYEIDGIVVVVNSNKIFNKLGVVGKAPRGAIAFKFPLKQATTIVEDIKVQIGRTGALTPVAVLKPVCVAGVIISRATLHNGDEIKRLDVKIGDTVIVGRAGDVIPDIIKVLPELRTGKEKDFKMPDVCPICKSRVERKSGEVAYYCKNPNCFAQQRECFCHFVSKSAFDIVGLGPKIIDKLIEAGLVSDPADLFKLEIGDILPLESLPRRSRPVGILRGFADKSAENLINSIQKVKNIHLAKFIYALGIRNVGEKTSQDLAKYFGSFEKLKTADFNQLQKIKDVGPVVAKSLYDWFLKKNNIKLISKLKDAGIGIENPKPGIKNIPRSGIPSGGEKIENKIFVLTGSLKSMNREKAKEAIMELGGEVSGSISKKTDYVVIGNEPGSKLVKAHKLGVKILTEREFLELLK